MYLLNYSEEDWDASVLHTCTPPTYSRHFVVLTLGFTSEFGLKKYIDSGLLHWHCSVLSNPVQVMICAEIETVLYSDEYQVICTRQSVLLKKMYGLEAFLQTRGDHQGKSR